MQTYNRERITSSDFESSIWMFAEYLCDICTKRCYPRQVSNVSTQQLSKHAKTYLPNELLERETLTLCGRCKTHVTNAAKKGHPARAYWNNLVPGSIPPELADLSAVECRMLSRIVVSLKIVKFDGKFGQHGFKGQAILFPQDVQEVPEQLLCKTLPRQIDDCGLIIVTEQLENVNVIRQLRVDTERLRRALVWLKENNKLYRDVEIDIPATGFDVNRICHRRVETEAGETADRTDHFKRAGAESRIVRASLHQGNCLFGDAAGTQCTAIAVAAIVKSKMFPMEFWSRMIVNGILLEGTEYYRAIRRSRGQRQEHEYLLVNEIDCEAQLFGRNVRIDFSNDPEIYGNTSGKYFDQVRSLQENLEIFFSLQESGVVICDSYSRAIMKREVASDGGGTRYFLFDSHSCGRAGAPCRKDGSNGTACVLETRSLHELTRLLKRNIGGGNHDYTIDRIDVAILDDNESNTQQHATDDGVSVVGEPIADGAIDVPIQGSVMMPVERNYPDVNEVVEIPAPQSDDRQAGRCDMTKLRRKTDRPVNVAHERKAEELAWYFLFPLGVNGLEEERPVRITPLDYFQTRILGSDTRFQRTDYLFYALSMFELLRTKSVINVCCKKIQKQGKIVEDLHLYVKNLRGSGAYWTDALNELVAMIMTLGQPTFFMTFSCNDLSWIDMRKALLLADGKPDVDPSSLSINETQQLIDKFPVVVSRQFMTRVNALMRLLCRDETIFGRKVVDYWWRIEFQNRGSPHLHMVLWLDNFPTVDSEEGIRMLDQIVTCALPKQEDDPEMHNLVTACQVHRHRPSCYKRSGSGGYCRYGFPRNVTDRTKILSQNANQLAANGGRTCVLKRQTGEEFVNNYCAQLLRIWRGNMDIQPCGSAIAIAYYVAKYIAKSEPTALDQTLREVIAKIRDDEASNVQSKMFKICMALLNKRQVSACECAFRLCHLPFRKSSRRCVFLNTRKPEKRYHVLRFSDNGGQGNEYCLQMFDRYSYRPTELDGMTIGEFAMTYEPFYGRKQRHVDEDNDDGDRDAYGSDAENDGDDRFIRLSDRRRSLMKMRTRPAVLRTPKFSLVKDPESYYYHLLLLHVPFREESELLADSRTARQAFVDRMKDLQERNRIEPLREYRRFEEELNAALEQVAAFIELEDGVRVDVPNDDVATEQDDGGDGDDAAENAVRMDDVAYRDQRGQMNVLQKRVFDLVTMHIRQEIESGSSRPLRLFITGGAGTGKSFVLRLLAEQIARCYRPLDPNGQFLRIGAPTGVAAQLVHGQTLHSLLKLPVQKDRRLPGCKPLTGKFLATMRRQWMNVRFLIVDEISMIPYETFVHIEMRLRELKNTADLFGGLNVLLFGDLLQLPPVSGHPIYRQPESMEGSLHLFRQFSFCELNENMRQVGDQAFVQLLNALREGKMSDRQLNMLVRRCEESKQQGEFGIGRAIRIVPTNAMVRMHNDAVIEETDPSIEKYHVVAQDKLVEETDRNADVRIDDVIPENINRTAGIPKRLTLYVGLRVMLRYNVSVRLGLCNGSMGLITNITWPLMRRGQIYDADIPKVEIDFDNGVGSHVIEPITVSFEAKLGYGLVERRMLPIVPCYAVTCHKLQGTTVDRAVVNLGKKYFAPGQKFVALSRARTLESIEIDELEPEGLVGDNVCNESALEEMERLRALPNLFSSDGN